METVIINQIKKQSYTMKESLRALKTSISFSGKGIKSILFTSSVPNEGKSTVVMDLARSMADSKKAVLIVDTVMDFHIIYQVRFHLIISCMRQPYRVYL